MADPLLSAPLAGITPEVIWKNGQPATAQSTIHDRAFLYGDGFFTTMAICEGIAGLFSYHQARLVKSAQVLSMAVDWAPVWRALADFMRQMPNGILKIVVSRGPGARGYLPPVQPADIYFIGSPFTGPANPTLLDTHGRPQLMPSIHLNFLGQRTGQVMPALQGIKTLNRLEQVMLRQEAQQHGHDEGLVLDTHNRLVSGISSNCFIYTTRQGWLTPPVHRCSVAGTTRAFLLDRITATGQPVRIEDYIPSPEDPVQAAFLCNALGIRPVATLNKQPLDLKKIDKLFIELYS